MSASNVRQHDHGHRPKPQEDDARLDQPTRCLEIPRFERLNYFYGQMLGVREFRTEQAYLREKLKLHNRYLHGHGVVCGLRVVPCPIDPKECDPEPPPPCVDVECGLAIDCCGNELVLRDGARLRLPDLGEQGGDVWLTICYREIQIQPTRPASLDECAAMQSDCVHAMVREDVCLRVSCEPPVQRKLCSACSDPCCDGCLLLAHVRIPPRGRALEAADIDNTVRRPISQFETTRIDRLGWTHGARYSRDDANRLLDLGLYLHFSRPVHASTVIAPGVFDLWAIQGGRGNRGGIHHIDTQAIPESTSTMIRSVRFIQDTDEVLQPGDRVMITLRSSFVLDECCRSLDGEHIVGLSPIADEYQQWDRSHEVPPPPCMQPAPRHLMPPMTGDGHPTGAFDSWFFIEPEQGYSKQRSRE